VVFVATVTVSVGVVVVRDGEELLVTVFVERFILIGKPRDSCSLLIAMACSLTVLLCSCSSPDASASLPPASSSGSSSSPCCEEVLVLFAGGSVVVEVVLLLVVVLLLLLVVVVVVEVEL
jgi:hypothetical protein